MIIANGCPKSGTHALMALLDTMGLRRCPGTILPHDDDLRVSGMPNMNLDFLRAIPDNCYTLGHVPARYDLSGFRVLTIFRDPRNVLISYIRHRERIDNLVFSVQQALADFWGCGFVAVYRGYLGWRGRSVFLRYEDMPPSIIGDGHGIYANHDRNWNTHTGSPSRWQDVWDNDCEQAWISCGGPKLLTEAGYD